MVGDVGAAVIGSVVGSNVGAWLGSLVGDQVGASEPNTTCSPNKHRDAMRTTSLIVCGWIVVLMRCKDAAMLTLKQQVETKNNKLKLLELTSFQSKTKHTRY